jgi:hypothetical protein
MQLRGVVVEVPAFVDVVSFFVEVVLPVLLEVIVGLDGAKLQDRFGAGAAPAGTGDGQAAFDEVSARSFDDAGGDRPAPRQGGRVFEVGALLGEVVWRRRRSALVACPSSTRVAWSCTQVCAAGCRSPKERAVHAGQGNADFDTHV